MQALHFLHLSDTHVNLSPEKGFIKQDVAAKLLATLESVASGPTKMDFCAITGDLAHEGDAEDYRFLAQILARGEEILGAPILCSLGNHDNREAFFRHCLGAEPRPLYTNVRTINGLRVICLDSKQGEHAITGRIGAEQLGWLSDVLREPAERGSLLAFHHPPIGPVQPDMDTHCLEDREELARVIQGSDVLGILSGHTHATAFAQFLPGVMSCTAGSTAFNLRLSGDAVQFLDSVSWTLGKVDGQGRLSCTAMQRISDRVVAEVPFASIRVEQREYSKESFPLVEKA